MKHAAQDVSSSYRDTLKSAFLRGALIRSNQRIAGLLGYNCRSCQAIQSICWGTGGLIPPQPCVKRIVEGSPQVLALPLRERRSRERRILPKTIYMMLGGEVKLPFCYKGGITLDPVGPLWYYAHGRISTCQSWGKPLPSDAGILTGDHTRLTECAGRFPFSNAAQQVVGERDSGGLLQSKKASSFSHFGISRHCARRAMMFFL